MILTTVKIYGVRHDAYPGGGVNQRRHEIMAKIKEAVKEIGLSDETLIIPVYSDVNDEACSVDDDGNAIFIEIDADGYSGKKETVRSAIKDAFGKMYKVYMR